MGFFLNRLARLPRWLATASAGRGPLSRLVEQVDPLAVVRSDLADRVVAANLLGPVVDERVPEGGPADREANEPGHRGGRGQPLPHLLVVLAAAQDDAA